MRFLCLCSKKLQYNVSIEIILITHQANLMYYYILDKRFEIPYNFSIWNLTENPFPLQLLNYLKSSIYGIFFKM